jgi:hypothetical protein
VNESKAIHWEQVQSDLGGACFRAKVPNGWLVMIDPGDGISITFVPDPKHEWELDPVTA